MEAFPEFQISVKISAIKSFYYLGRFVSFFLQNYRNVIKNPDKFVLVI